MKVIFRYQQDGTIQPAEKTDEAAEYTITKLNLNDKRLCRAEKTLYGRLMCSS